MKYYKQLNGNEELVALCSCNDDSVPIGVTELTEEEYRSELDLLSKKDAETEAKRKADEEAAEKEAEDKRNADVEAEEAKHEEEVEAAEKEAQRAEQERKDAVDEYVSKVKSGEVVISDVPSEYRSEVDDIINPPITPPSNEELNERLEAAQEAIDFLMTTVAGNAE